MLGGTRYNARGIDEEGNHFNYNQYKLGNAAHSVESE